MTQKLQAKLNQVCALIEKIPYAVLIVVTVIMLLAPLRPMPHVVEKLIKLANGGLRRPIDIFDLFYHIAPLIVLLVKMWLDFRAKRYSRRQE